MKSLIVIIVLGLLATLLALSKQAPPEYFLLAQFTNAPTVAATIGPYVESSQRTNRASSVTNQMMFTTAGANRLLLLFVSWSDNTATRLTNVNCNGTNLTILCLTNYNASAANTNAIYYLIAPSSGSIKVWMRWNGTINEIATIAVNVTNANQSSPFGTPVIYSSEGTSVLGSTNTTTTSSLDLVLDQITYVLDMDLRVGNGQTVVNTSTNAGGTIETRVAALIASGASTITSWTNYNQSDVENYITVPIKP